jgi:uncharacterized membrane protein HdeD (DUF308 family)
MTMTAEDPAYAAVRQFPWWLALIQGIALIVLGVLFFTAPGETTAALVVFLGFYLLISGIMSLIGLLMDRRQWGLKLLSGILGIVAGMAIIRHPLWSTILVPGTLIIVVGGLGLAYGILEAIRAFVVRRWSGVALGVVTALLGLAFVMNPLVGIAALPWVFGFLALVGGAVSIAIAATERTAKKEAERYGTSLEDPLRPTSGAGSAGS